MLVGDWIILKMALSTSEAYGAKITWNYLGVYIICNHIQTSWYSTSCSSLPIDMKIVTYKYIYIYIHIVHTELE